MTCYNVNGNLFQGQISVPSKGRWAYDNVKLLHLFGFGCELGGKVVLISQKCGCGIHRFSRSASRIRSLYVRPLSPIRQFR